MLPISYLKDRLQSVFNHAQTEVLLELVQVSYNDLVKTSNFDELKAIMRELALAQKELQEEVKKLTLAQKETQEEIKKLTIDHQEMKKEAQQTKRELRELARQVGSLSMVVGYSLEDKLYPYLEEFASKVYRIEVQEIILRKNIIYDNEKFDEINIFIQGNLNNKTVYAIGECKAQASKKDIQRFWNILERFELIYQTKAFPFFVSYHYHPQVEEFLKKEYPNIQYFKSYEIESGKYLKNIK